jgi:hypothetical protein
MTVNGQVISNVEAGSWLCIERLWEHQNRVRLVFDMHTRSLRFDASELESDDPLVAWATETWAALRNLEPGAPPSSISVEDAVPHADAFALVRGPLVLASDRRLDDDGVDPILAHWDPQDPPKLERIAAPEGIWAAFEATSDAQGTVRLCDFSSAGNTWDQRSRFSTWFPGQSKP